jgi:hypothetical protein
MIKKLQSSLLAKQVVLILFGIILGWFMAYYYLAYSSMSAAN